MIKKPKSILITGASTGIGYDLVKIFSDHNYQVFGSVRKQEDAERLSKSFGKNFTPLLFDVTDYDAIAQAADKLKTTLGGSGLGGLINNAGIAVAGPFMDLDVDDYRHQFEINVFGLIKVTQAFLPLLGAVENCKHEPGRIVQISSMAGRQGMPFMSPYSGSKHAVEGISESLRRELLKYGIGVILIEPGPIKTPIWEKANSEHMEEKFQNSVFYSALKNFQSKLIDPAIEKAWTSEKAAKIIFRAFETKRPKARYLLIPQKFIKWTLPNLLPYRVVDKVVGDIIGLTKK